ncbi:MAG: ribbon-helix-helix domain-containing protein [Spirochaetia bacterium]|nr:ribbon-helix-helix domain-containing protein [Spirochaetia bacterium]
MRETANPKTKNINYRLPTELYDELMKIVKANRGMTISLLMRDAAEFYLKYGNVKNK